MTDPVLHVVIPGPPKGKASVRVYSRGGRIGRVMPTASWESHAALVLAAAWGGRPTLTGPVRVDVLVVLARPARLRRRKDPAGLIPAPVRPDGSNAQKAIEDAVTKAGVWADDGQVVEWSGRKMYAERDGAPRVEVTIWTLPGGP